MQLDPGSLFQNQAMLTLGSHYVLWTGTKVRQKETGKEKWAEHVLSLPFAILCRTFFVVLCSFRILWAPGKQGCWTDHGLRLRTQFLGVDHKWARRDGHAGMGTQAWSQNSETPKTHFENHKQRVPPQKKRSGFPVVSFLASSKKASPNTDTPMRSGGLATSPCCESKSERHFEADR